MNPTKPIKSLLGWLACGGSLTDDDLAELPLETDTDRAAIEDRIREAAAEILEHRREGNNGSARAVAREVGLELAALVQPEPKRPPTRAEVNDLIAEIPQPLR